MGALGKILATTDLHDRSAAGLAFAASLARDYEGELHVLHVMSSQEIGDLDLPTHSQDHMAADAGEHVARLLDDHIAAVLGDGAPPHTAAVTFGSPAMEILRYAREHDCSVVVITVSSRSRVGKLLLGSDTLEMLAIADLPVIVVPAA